jgi:hypothetical protein
MSIFDDAVQQFVAIATEVNHAGTAHFTHVPPTAFTIDNNAKFVRVNMGTSVYAFVDRATGDIIYPAGWRGPVRKPSGVRGNIYDADHGRQACRTYGLRTLR